MMSTRNKIITCLVVILLSVFFGWKSNTIYTGYIKRRYYLSRKQYKKL